MYMYICTSMQRNLDQGACSPLSSFLSAAVVSGTGAFFFAPRIPLHNVHKYQVCTSWVLRMQLTSRYLVHVVGSKLYSTCGYVQYVVVYFTFGWGDFRESNRIEIMVHAA